MEGHSISSEAGFGGRQELEKSGLTSTEAEARP